MVNRSSSGTCAVCDQRTVPEGTSISCTATRTALRGVQQSPGDRRLDPELGGQRAQIQRAVGEARRRQARSHGQRVERRQRHRDRVGQAERQEVHFGIRPQHAERQHHQPLGRPRLHHLAGVAAGHRGAEIRRHVLRRLIPILARLGDGALDDPVEIDHGRRSHQRRRMLVHDRVQDVDRRGAAERRAPAQHLVEHEAGGEEVGAGVDLLAAHLLRRHVARRPHHHAGHGQRRSRRGWWWRTAPGRSRAA